MNPSPAIRREDRSLRWLVMAAYVLAAALPLRGVDALPVLCPFRRLTGLPCPGCGGTHAFVAMAHGQFSAAWGYNPLAVAVFLAGLVWLFLTFTGRAPRLPRRAGLWGGVGFVAVSLLFGAWRIAGLLYPAGR